MSKPGVETPGYIPAPFQGFWVSSLLTMPALYATELDPLNGHFTNSAHTKGLLGFSQF
jgi:hypothetical protein